MSNETVIEIRKEGEIFLRSLNLEIYRNLSGLKKDCDLSTIYRSHPYFNVPDLFLTLKDISSINEEEEKGLRLLRSFLSRTALESQTAHIRDEILSAETRGKIQIEQKKIPYRAYSAEIKNEPNRIKRDEIDLKRRELVLKLNPLILKTLDIYQNVSERLGYSTYQTLLDELEQLETSKLEEKAKIFLSDTEYIYRDLLNWFLQKRMEIKIEDARIHDLYFLFNSYELKANFPKIDLISLAKKFLNEMGLEIGENIQSDLGKRTGKVTKPFCTPIEVPNNIIYSIYPIGGVEDYESFFHGLGTALCLGYSQSDDYFEYRRLRELTALEIFALLLKNLILQPRWLKKYLNCEPGSDFMEFLYLRQLMILRYYCGKLSYEVLIHKNRDFQNIADIYEQLIKEATLAENNEADYLIDIAPFFSTATYLKASFIEAGFRSYLRDNFDEEWWRNAETGIFLCNLWKDGGRITSSDIAKIAGFDELDLTSLYESLNEHLG